MNLSRRPLALILLLTAACAPSDQAANGPTGDNAGDTTAAAPAPPPASETIQWVGYRAAGNEPFWTLTFSDSRIDFSDLGDANTTNAPVPQPEQRPNGWRFATTAGGEPFVVDIEDTGCNDSMSGTPFPHTVTVSVNGMTFSGCGGETASLLTGAEWRVTRIESAETAPPQPTMAFATDGSLTGHSGCNGFRATYELTGEGMTIGPAIATRMACAEPALNARETVFFTLLEQVTRFDVVDGALHLHAGDGAVMVAER